MWFDVFKLFGKAYFDKPETRKGIAGCCQMIETIPDIRGQVYTLREHEGQLELRRHRQTVAVFADPKNMDLANTICNILNAEETRWPA